ncbi:uncharacterized protein LOC118428599 [Branchiostoma floridae]|uniref:Uncharacterized protein LOC118428599 n=2 Tax=Branchiostoma floridae TaxID=7739 RepID=A0A9J7M5C0_BRAFL|nr:uncharacterized protein LOC118428599 [Branchiostoma floridae]
METTTTPPVTTTMEPVATTSLTTTRLSPEETATTPPVTTTMEPVATTSLTTTSPEAVQCPALTPPANGAQSPTGVNSYNDEVMFTCNQGYELEGASSVRCQANRAWSGPVPTCRVCTTSTDAEYRYRWDLPPVTGSRFEFEVQASGDVNVALSAQNQDLSDMYEVVIGGWSNRKSVIRRSKLGAVQAEAQTPGINSPNQYRRFWITWADGTIAVGRGNEIDPFIQWVDPDPLNISYAGYSTYMSSSGQWRFCSPGIRLMGGSSSSEGRVEVYHDGQWGTVCDDDFDMNDANVICRQLGYGSALEARSKAAFGAGSDPIWLDDLNCGGSETSIEDCTHNGWGSHNCGHHEDAGVVCSGAAQCPALTPPANGTLSPTGVNSYNDEVMFTCNQGYELEGASSVRCQANRAWSDLVPTCTVVQCPALTPPANGTLSPTGVNSYNDEVMFTCNQGYEMEGASSVRCQANRAWSDPVPTCRVCNTSTDAEYLYRWDLPPVTGSRFEFEVQAGDHVHVALSAQNQDLSNMYEVVIGGWGNSWSVIRLSKQGANQAEAQTPGITSPNQYRRFWITWADGGTIAVGRGSEINPFLQWVDPNPLPISYAGYSTGWGIAGQWRFCSPAAQCPVPTPPANGSLSPTGVNSYNDEVMFTCNQGYELEGASSVRCQANRTWSSPVPTCADADECATANGRCDHICSNFPGGYRCFCRLGFVLMGDAHGCGVCGRCQGGDVNCDPLSGVCSSGCQDGWKTQLCDKAVDPPMDLAVTDITDDGFKVTWSPSPDPDLDLEGYRVVVSRLDIMTAVNQSTAETSFPVVGLSPETAYIIRVTALFSSVGWKAQSETAMILVFTAATPTTTPAPALTTEQKSRETTLLSTEPEASTVQNTQEAMRDGGSSDDAAATTTATATTKQTSGMTTVLSTRPSTQVQLGSEATETTETSSRPPAEDKATPGQALGNGLDSIFAGSLSAKPQDVLQKLAQTADVPGDAVVLGQPTSAAEEKAQDIAVGVLKSITSNLDKLDMSDPATVQSVGGSLVESVGSLLEEPERDTQEDDGKLASDLEEDQSLSPKERLEKAEEREEEKQAEKRRNVQESRRVLDGLFDAIMGSMSPGAPAVTIERGGVALRAERVWGDQFGGRVVQMEDGSFHLPSKAALFPDYTPHNVAIRLTQFQQNPFTWGRGEYQARSSVMELSLLQNDIPVAFNNLTEDFNITIPGGSGNKPATTTITFPAPGNQSSSYHLLKLNSTAEGFLVTITPLNTSVVYGVWGRYGGRPDDQNYNMSTETYILPEECALMKSLSGDEDTNTEKTEATIFILGGDGPADYYIKVQVLGPVTECDMETKTDMKESDSNDFYAYRIQWVRLGCIYWSETQEDWRTDGCTISEQSTITSTICHCNHLTAFGLDFATPPNTLDFGALNFSDLVDNGAVLTTIIVALCLFSLTSAVIKIAERKDKRKLHHAVRLDDLQNGYLYRLLVWTGAARHAGTESTVTFKLVGDAANSDVRVVNIAEKVFTQGSQVTLTFSIVEQLGNVEQLQLMHDNSGEGSRASWHVDRAAVEDVTTGKTSYFFCNEWLAADRGDGQVVKTFPVATEQDLRSFGFLFPVARSPAARGSAAA